MVSVTLVAFDGTRLNERVGLEQEGLAALTEPLQQTLGDGETEMFPPQTLMQLVHAAVGRALAITAAVGAETKNKIV